MNSLDIIARQIANEALQRSIRSGGGGGGGTVTIGYVSAVQENGNFTVVPNTIYLVDTSAGPVTATMPAFAANQVIGFTDWKATWGTHNFTVTPPSGKQLLNPATGLYLSAGTPAVLSVNGVTAAWIYDGTLFFPAFTG
jgi:hypothetical protein